MRAVKIVMTIVRTAPMRRAANVMIVIMGAALSSANPATAADLLAAGRLTTSPAASVPAAAALTTVIVSGSSVYDAPRLFDAYGTELGKPISRESARAVVDALSGLYAADGYVKPEIRLDDAMAGRGV